MQTPNEEANSSLRSPCFVLELDTFTSQKVMVIPYMTEKLLSGTLSKYKIKRNQEANLYIIIVLGNLMDAVINVNILSPSTDMHLL